MITQTSRSILSLVCTAGAVAAVLFGGAVSTAFAAASLTPLGGLNGTYSQAYGVSDNGSVVVGDAIGNYNYGEAFRWTSAGGMVGLGSGLPSVLQSHAYGVSGDGSVVVGQGGFPRPVYGGVRDEAFRWTTGGGMVALGILPGGIESTANGVSADGSVIVGDNLFSQDWDGSEAFRWTSDGGMVGLGYLPGGVRSAAHGISADGSVVVGSSYDLDFRGQAFRWTSGGGMVGLGDLPGGEFSSGASGVSADGSVIVGAGTSASGSEAFRWTSDDGMVGLGDLPGGSGGYARGVSGDGSIVVGSSFGPSSVDFRAFYWTADGGIRALWDVLLSQGVNPAADGWSELSQALDISDDGNTIVGYGTRNDGGYEAFVAVIPTIVPEPGTFSILALGALAALRRRRSRPACCETLEPRRLLSFAPAVTYAAGADPREIIAADFNNDGRLDLVVANPTANSVNVLLGNGNGTFRSPLSSAAGTNPRSIAVGDFNTDGKLDLAAVSGEYSFGISKVNVMLGNGNGTFHSPFAVPEHSPSTAVSVGVADFNADQKMDLVVVSDIEYSSGTGGWIEVLFGDGAGAFPISQLTEGSPASPSLLAIDDLNADGTPEVVVAGSGYVEVWLGDGGGNFWMPYFTTGLGGQGSVGDFTGDGILDLVIAGQTVDVLPGLGDGTFAAPLSNPTNGNPAEAVAVADFNGDGKLDAVTSDGDTDTVSLLLGNGDGTLSYTGAFATGSSPSAVALGDFNGDGRPDVAVTNGGSNNVSVLLNDGNWPGSKTFVGPGGNGSGGNWSNANNWSPAGVPAASDDVSIAGKSVTLSSNAAVAGLSLAGGGTLSIASNGSRVLRTASIQITGTGSKLDLKDNDLIVDYAGASPVSAIESLARTGYHTTGDWLGAGITSSVAAANGSFTLAVADNALLAAPFGTAQGGPLFAGQNVDLSTVFVKFTHRADLNLDGRVTPDDSAIFGGSYDENQPAKWSTGDLNYDGLFTPDDAAIFGGAYDEFLPLV